MNSHTALQLTALFFLAGVQLPAQSPTIRFERIGVNDGLSNSTVAVIAQDRTGFIWLGTEDGLNRFDGLGFTRFYNNPRDSSSIPANVVYALLTDRKGTFWVGTAQGLCSYDPAFGAFVRTPILLKGDSHPRHLPAVGIAQDGKGALWISTADSIYEMLPDETTPLTVRRSVVGGSVPLVADQFGNIWFARESGIVRYRCDTDTLELLPLPHLPRLRQILAIAVQGDSILWLGSTADGAVRYNLKNATVDHFVVGSGEQTELSADVVSRILADGHGSVWLSTFAGVDRYNEREGTITHFTETPFNPYSLLGKRGEALFLDRAGILWIGTYHGGVNRFDPYRNRFGHLLPITPNPRDEQNGVRAVVETRNGGLWVGTDYGLRHFSRKNEGFILDPPVPRIPPHLRQGAISALCEDADGSLWVGAGESLHHFDPQSGRIRSFQHRPEDPRSFGGSGVLVIYRDRENEVWIGTEHQGADRYDRRNGEFVHYRYDPADSGSLYAEGVWAIFEDSRGRLWFGGWNVGMLNAYDRRSGRFTRYAGDPNDSQSISSNATRAICEDSDGNLWFGTWGGGLNRLDAQTNRFSRYTQLEGLPSDYIKGMLLDRRGKLWISSERGLTAFSIATGTPRNFTEGDGLQSDFFYSNSSSAGAGGAGGLLTFGGTCGLTFFYPDSIRDNGTIPAIAITGMKVFDEPVRLPWTEKKISLSHDQNFVSFEFVALDYSDPSRNQYAYRMAGLEEEWHPCGTRRYAAYTHLDPGSYTFQVKGSNNDGIWNEAGASLVFTIAPPFWSTWWFRALAVGAIALLLTVAYRYRIAQLLKVEHLRARIAADLHDDVGSNLSSIALGSQLLSRKLKLSPGEQSQLDEIGMTALQTSEMMKEIVWLLNPKNDSLDDLLLRMKSVAASLLRETSYRFDGPQEKLAAKVALSTKRNLFLMYKEILNNVVRHSGATEVAITVAYERGTIHLEVRDNGRGFDPAHPVPGNGLGNLAERSRQIGARLRITSAPGKGTAVAIDSQIT